MRPLKEVTMLVQSRYKNIVLASIGSTKVLFPEPVEGKQFHTVFPIGFDKLNQYYFGFDRLSQRS